MSILWACFALPELPLEAVDRRGMEHRESGCSEILPAQSDSQPFALHDNAAQRPHIVCANAAARTAGIRAGMALAQAMALAPDLIAQRHDPTAQTRRLELLAALAYGFSSHVVLEPPDAVLLEIGASRSLFGDWKNIQRALRARLTELGHRAVLAAAPTPAAARVLAGLADGYAVAQQEHLTRVLARVPIGAARLSAEHTGELRRIGVRTLGEVFVLPRAALARRFGEGLLQALDWLRGSEIDPRVRYQPPDRFERRLEFDYGIVNQDGLRFPLQRLARELAAFLHARDGGVLRFVLRFEHDPHEHPACRQEVAAASAVAAADASASMLEVGLRKPCRDADALFEAARQALERIALPAPAHALVLIANDLPPFAPELRDLFDPGLRGSLDWDALAERLRARLGDGAVREITAHADHRPERAWRVAEPQHAYPRNPGRPSPQEPTAPQRSLTVPACAPRPLWLLPKPIPFRGRIVRLLEATERIETGWWDDDDIRRDYAIADLDSGQRAWLFRLIDGSSAASMQASQPDPGDASQGWMLHGWFA